MSTKIGLPGGAVAEMDDEGNWSCPEEPEIARLLNEIGESVPGRHYLPDPFEERTRVVIERTGAEIVNYLLPKQETGEEGRIY